MHLKTVALNFLPRNIFKTGNRIALFIWFILVLIIFLVKSTPMQGRYNEDVDVPVKINKAPLLVDSRNCIWLVQDTNTGPKLVELKSPCMEVIQ